MSARILVVEDEMLVGMDLAMMLEDWGYHPDGPHASVRDSLSAIRESRPDAAILDMNLGRGETSMPVAEALQEQGIPFVFLTGYTRFDAAGNPLAETVLRMRKPVAEGELRAVLDGLVK
jgi:DNA-binding NtrC family response regulator